MSQSHLARAYFRPSMEELPEQQEEEVSPLPENQNVTVVELWGKKYNQIFNPKDGTVRLEPLVE